MLNAQQIEATLRWLLTAGGPAYAFLSSKGWAPVQIGDLATLLMAVVPPAIGYVWSLFRKTDKQIALQAASVTGAPVQVNMSTASTALQAAALDRKVEGIVPKA